MALPWVAPPSMACAHLSAADTHVAAVSPSPLREGKHFLKGWGGGEGDMRPAERPHLSRWQTKDRGSAWSIAGGACLLLRMERAILCWPRGLGHVLRRGKQCVGSEQLGPGIQNPKQVSSRHPQPRPPQAEESGFNFLVSAKRRRKRTRRRRRKERVEVPVQWAGICHSAHSPLTTKGSRAVSGP